jgi:hypothetical protein
MRDCRYEWRLLCVTVPSLRFRFTHTHKCHLWRYLRNRVLYLNNRVLYPQYGGQMW